MSFTSMHYFPAKSEYDFYNIEFYWKSAVSVIASFKIEATFQILVIARNKNHFDVERAPVSCVLITMARVRDILKCRVVQ